MIISDQLFGFINRLYILTKEITNLAVMEMPVGRLLENLTM